MEKVDMPSLSVVVITHEQCDALRRHLPAMLEQEYPAGFEVIVVDMNSTDDTMLFLEQMAGNDPRLHTIQFPTTARNVSPIRLALTLGIRAASYDWTILTNASCMPSSPHWLTHMAELCSKDENTQIVLGITRFVGGKGWHGLRCRFFRIWQQMLNITYAQQHGAYRADGTNLAYRRSLFLEHRGFADHSNLLVGATEIMVNQHSTRMNTALCTHPDAIMLVDTPQYNSWWSKERLFFMETRRHFRHVFLYRLRYMWNIILIWVPSLLTITAVAGGLYFKNYLIIAMAALFWTTYNTYITYKFNKKIKQFGEQPFTLSYIILSHLIPWWDMTAWLRWLFTKQRTFQKKFI